MTETEKRIRILEDKAAAPDSDTPFIRTLALCEIARQLSRLGDIYEFELGINDDYRPNLPVRGRRRHTGTHPLSETTCDDPTCWCRAEIFGREKTADPTTLAEIFRKEKKP